MIDVEALTGELGEAIDRAALDPAQWPGVLDAICDALPGTRATIHVADTRDRSSISVVQRGFEAGQMARYEQHYANINPWTPHLMGLSPLRPYISDEQLPSSSFRETEFYRDWLAHVGDMDCTVGMKLVHEADRIGVIAIHHPPMMAEPYNALVARVLKVSATRLRRAIDAARLAGRRDGGSLRPVPLGAFLLPAFLLDGRGRVLELNGPAKRLVDAPAPFSLDFRNVLRLGSEALTERVLAAVRQIAAGRGPWSDGVDLPLAVEDGRWFTASLLAVREPASAGVPAFFAAPRLALLLLRPGAGGDAAGPPAIDPGFGLTRAERRLAAQLSSGRSLQQSADRLGITYETARSQLKAVFGKTGTSRQAELVALLARLRATRAES